MHKPSVVGLTTGCPAGIGPEVSAAAIAALAATGPLLRYFGNAEILQAGARSRGLQCRTTSSGLLLGTREVLCSGGEAWLGTPGKFDDKALAIQKRSLEEALEAARRGEIGALYTAPIRKQALDDVYGRAFAGHTELLGHQLGDGTESVTMVFAGGPFMLALCTVHLPLRDVSDAITVPRTITALHHLADALESFDAVDATDAQNETREIVVLGVNPHAGEGGRLGREETDILLPAIAQFARTGFVVRGPVPADGFFADVARGNHQNIHGVLAMAHDQGLAPYKLLTAGAGVNMTLGLSLLRTSPDHGTADAIAGQGLADTKSASAALELAHKAAQRRVLADRQ